MVVIATIHDTSIILRHIGRRNLLHLVAILEPSFGRFRLLYRIGCMRKWTFMQKVPRGQWAFSALDAPSRKPGPHGEQAMGHISLGVCTSLPFFLSSGHRWYLILLILSIEIFHQRSLNGWRSMVSPNQHFRFHSKVKGHSSCPYQFHIVHHDFRDGTVLHHHFGDAVILVHIIGIWWVSYCTQPHLLAHIIGPCTNIGLNIC